MNLCHDAVADNQRRIKKVFLGLFIFLAMGLSTLPFLAAFFAERIKKIEDRQHALLLRVEKNRERERHQQALREKMQYQKKAEAAIAFAQKKWRWRAQILSTFAKNPLKKMVLHKMQWQHCELRVEGETLSEADFKENMAFMVNHESKLAPYKMARWQARRGSPWTIQFEVTFKQCLS